MLWKLHEPGKNMSAPHGIQPSKISSLQMLLCVPSSKGSRSSRDWVFTYPCDKTILGTEIAFMHEILSHSLYIHQ